MSPSNSIGGPEVDSRDVKSGVLRGGSESLPHALESQNDVINWDRVKQEQDRGRKGKIPNTILEEDDSSELDL